MEFLDKDRFDYECGIARDVVPLLRRLKPEYIDINDLLARSLVIAELLERIDAMTTIVRVGTVSNCEVCANNPKLFGFEEVCDEQNNACTSCGAACICKRCAYGEKFEPDWEKMKEVKRIYDGEAEADH